MSARDLGKVRAFLQEAIRESNRRLIETNRRLYLLKRRAREETRLLLEHLRRKR